MSPRNIFVLVLLISGLFSVQPMQAAPGDTLGEAIDASLGSYTGDFTAYNQAFYYNFSGNPFQSYNFSVVREISAISAYPLYVYSSTGVEIASNNSIEQSKSLVVSGYSEYSIRLFTTEFTETPDNFTLTLAIHDTDAGKSLNTAITAQVGTQTGNLTSYDDFDLFNLTATPGFIYNISLSHSADTYYSLYIYDSDTNRITENFDTSASKYVVVSGESHYIIGVYASEFSTTPHPYTLTITEIDPNHTETTTVVSTVTIRERVETASSFSNPLPLRITGGFVLVMLAMYGIRRRRHL